MRGRFITFEGLDGAGKSTQLDALAGVLQARGVPFVRTREPGGTPVGEQLRALMLGLNMTPLTETLLMFAARAEHVARVIAPALGRGEWVLCDRYIDASYAYQGAGRGVPADRLDRLSAWIGDALAGGTDPDLTVLVDIEPAEAERRRATARTADRFESEPVAFFSTVREAYLRRAAREPGRFLVVDGADATARIQAHVHARIQAWLP